MAAKAIGGEAGAKIHAGGKVYQAGEFVCEWCNVPLVLDTYYTIDGKNVCQSCRNKERCASCGFLITETKYVTVDDKLYHPDCFVCSECFIDLQKFHLKDDKLFCPECVHGPPDAPADPCGKCGLQLKGDVIKALGKRFHEECFVCHCCFKEFPNDEFVNVSGNPFCDNCINDQSYLRSTAHIKATSSPAGSARADTGSAGAGTAAGAGSGAPRSAPGPFSGAAGYGSGSGANTGAGAGSSAGSYGDARPGVGPGGGSSSGAGGYGAGGSSAGGSSAGGSGVGAGGSSAGGSGIGAGGSSSGARSGASRSVDSPAFSVGQVKNDDLQYASVDDDLDLSQLPPKGESKYAKKSKTKFGGGVKEEKRQRDYKSKPAIGFSGEADHLKDLDSLKYMTIRK